MTFGVNFAMTSTPHRGQAVLQSPCTGMVTTEMILVIGSLVPIVTVSRQQVLVRCAWAVGFLPVVLAPQDVATSARVVPHGHDLPRKDAPVSDMRPFMAGR